MTCASSKCLKHDKLLSVQIQNEVKEVEDERTDPKYEAFLSVRASKSQETAFFPGKRTRRDEGKE